MKLKNIYRLMSPEEREKLKKFLKARIEAALPNFRLQSQRRAIDFQLYVAKHLGNEVKGRPKVVIPHAFKTVQSLLPDIMDIIGNPDVAQIGPATSADVDCADYHQRLLEDQQEHELNWWPLVDEWVSTALIYSTGGYVEWGWEDVVEFQERSYDSISLEDHERIMAEGGEQLAGEQVWSLLGGISGAQYVSGYSRAKYRERIILKHGPYAEVVPPEDLIVDERATKFDQSRFAVRIVRQTLDEVLSDGDRRDYDPEETRELVEAFEQGRPTGSTDQADVAFERAQRYTELGQADPHDTQEFYADNPGLSDVDLYRVYFLWDLDGDGRLEKAMAYLVAGQDLVLGVYDNVYEAIPIVRMDCIRVHHTQLNVSVPSLVEHMQRILTGLWRAGLTNMAKSAISRPVAERNRGIDAVALEQGRDGDVIWTDPGGSGAIKYLVHPSIIGEIMAMAKLIEAEDEKETGNSAYNQGTNASSLNKTARGLTQIMQASQKRVTKLAHDMGRGGLLLLISRLVEMNKKFLVEPKKLFVATDQPDLTITSQMLQGRVKLKININPGGGRQAKWESAQRVYELVVAEFKAGRATPENVWYAAQGLLKAEGRYDVDKLLPRPEEVMRYYAEFQQRLAQWQGGAGGPGGQGAPGQGLPGGPGMGGMGPGGPGGPHEQVAPGGASGPA